MQPGRLAVVDSDALDALTGAQLRDGVAATDADAIVAPSAGARVRLRGEIADPGVPILGPEGTGDGGAARSHRLGDARVLEAWSDAAVGSIPALLAEGDPGEPAGAVVISDRLDCSVRPTALRTVWEGYDAFIRALAEGEHAADACVAGSLTLCSTALPAEYAAEWDGLRVRGIGREAMAGVPSSGRPEPGIVGVTIGADGSVATREYDRTSLGLRAVEGVGEHRATTLRAAGIEDRPSLADADVARLADVDGLDRSTAARLVAHARAFEDGRVLRQSDARLPGPEPVFVDLETDGLSPTVVPLIGVLDRAHGSYRTFAARDPADPAGAIEAFCSWYAALEGARPIVAYNGASFDFPVLGEQIAERVPECRSLWADAWTLDPYESAVGAGNAVLPGRTNRLEDVAEALGVDGIAASDDTTVLSGASVGRQFRRWHADPDAAPPPAWDAIAAYCEADVRALAGIYDAIEAADRVERPEAGTDAPPSETTQGRLGEF